MADLYNLLGELDQREDEEQDFVKGRPSTAGTEATAESEWGSPSLSPGEAEVPLVLQQAHREKDTGAKEDFAQDLLESEEGTRVENELYTKLHRHWFQERHCPELLEFDEDMAQDIKTHLEDRRDWLDQQDGVTDAVEDLMVTFTQMDTERVRFVFSDWLTRRLAKVEAHPLYMREKVDHMSDGELRYLKSYGELYESHLRNTVLDHVPEAWQRLDEDTMIDKPDYDSYHFWLAKEAIDKNDTEHDKGTCLVAKYKDMREMMVKDQVELQL